MRKLILGLALIPAFALATPEYRPGWTAGNFYGEVAACEAAMTLPAFDSYQKRGLAAGQSDEAMRNDTIAMAPVLQAVGSRMCFCALNDLAKDITYSSFSSDKRKLQGYVSGHCKTEAQQAMTRQHAEELRLK